MNKVPAPRISAMSGMPRHLLVMTAVALLSAGCAASSPPPLPNVTPIAPTLGVTPPSTAATLPAPPATGNATARAGITLAPRRPTGTVPAAGELNVTFERSGGFTGRIETFRLKPDGSVDDGKVVLHAAGGSSAAAILASQIAATGIYSVAPGRYMAANTCCDRFEYDLTLTQNGLGYNFMTIDSAESEPPALVQTIRLISQYISTAN